MEKGVGSRLAVANRTLYAITDDLLKAIGHKEDCRRAMNDAEIITTAICAAMFFNGNHSKACSYSNPKSFMRKHHTH